MTWTRFSDQHSGGYLKVVPYEYIYIEAPREKAIAIFKKKLRHNPTFTSCKCCSVDYSIIEWRTLEDATGFERNLIPIQQKRSKQGRYIPMPEGIPYWLEPGQECPVGYHIDPIFLCRKQHGIKLETFLAQPNVLVIHSNQTKPKNTNKKE